jgi:nitrous oxidase accessory protein NosD
MKAKTNLVIVILLFSTLNMLTIETQFFNQFVKDEKHIEMKTITDDQGKTIIISYNLNDLSLTCDGKGQSLEVISVDILTEGFIHKPVSSISIINSPAATIVVGERETPIILNNNPNQIIVNGTIANITDSSYTYGIIVNDSENTRVQNVTIFNITSTSNSASGIHVENSYDFKSINNTINKITSTSTSFSDPRNVYGIHIESSDDPIIEKTIIEHLTTDGIAFGIFAESAPEFLMNNSVIDDINSKLSQGVYLKDSQSPLIRNTTITNLLSSTQSSYGISLENCNESSVILNSITTVDAALHISGILLDNCSFSFVENNTIESLTSTYTDVYGIDFTKSSGSSIQWNNLSDLDAPNAEAIGINAEESTNLVFGYNTITDVTPSVGLYIYSCSEANIIGNTISSVEKWIYIDETSPNATYSSNNVEGQVIRLQNFTRPIDQYIEQNSANKFISWIASDSEAATYSIFRDGNLITEGIWIDGSAIDHPVNESLAIGFHTYQMILTETDGQNITDDVKISIVEMDEPEFVETPDDLRYLVGAPNQVLSWILTDNYPSTYTIYRNDTEIAFDSWSSDELITIPVSGLALGVYNYTLIANDVSGNTVSHSVLVYVFQASDIFIETKMASTMQYDYITTGNIEFYLNWTVYCPIGGFYSIYQDNGTIKQEIDTGAFDPGIPILYPFSERLSVGAYNFSIVANSAGNIIEDYIIIYIIATPSIPAQNYTHITGPRYTIPPYLSRPPGNPWPLYITGGVIILTACIVGYLFITRRLMVPSIVKEERKAIKKARKSKDIQEEGERLGAIGRFYYESGNFKEAIKHHKDAIKIFRKTGNTKSLIQGLESLGNAYLAQGVEEINE